MSKNSAVRKKQPVSEEVLLAQIDVEHTRAKGLRALVTCLGGALIVAATALPAWLVAGKQTVVDVTIVLSLSLAISLAGVGALAWGRQQKKRADGLDRRNKVLSRDVKELQQRLRAAGLPSDVSR